MPGQRNEALAFWQMRMRIVAALLRQTLSESRFRLALVAVLSVVLWGGMFWLFMDLFGFLKAALPEPAAVGNTVRTLFSMFFAGLMLMLTFSSVVLLHGFLFRAADLTLLLTLPVRIERVFLHKFQEAIFFSSWAFMLLGTPMLLAYGVSAAAPWYYYALLPAFLAAFTYIPAGVAAVVCLFAAYWLPRGRVPVFAVAAAITAAVGAWLFIDALSDTRNILFSGGWFHDVFLRFRFSNHQLLPSWWLGSGLIEAAQRGWSESVLFLCLIISNALLLRQLAIWTAARVYRDAYSGLQGRRSDAARGKTAWCDRVVLRLHPIPMRFRVLLLKDFRLFRRDAAQWSQLAVFFALLAVYFLNIRRFSDNINHPGWVNMISFLNISVVGLILSTLTTRFVFPMVSLEAGRFWILGLVPVRRGTVLWSMFFFATVGTSLPCVVLVALSDYMLNVHPLICGIHQMTGILLCFGLSGIAVGLGARMPVPGQQSPARISAGFGGTLNLVLSAFYIMAMVLLTALPAHFHQVAYSSSMNGFFDRRPAVLWWLNFWLLAGAAASIVLAAVATYLPMWIGLRAFRRMEF